MGKKRIISQNVFFFFLVFAMGYVQGAVWKGFDEGDVWSEDSNWSTGLQPIAGEKVQVNDPSAQRWRYIEWGNSGSQGRELYDHQTDPAEYNNLAEDPTYVNQILYLQTLLYSGQNQLRK